MTEPAPILRMLGVHKKFGAIAALHSVDLTVRRGEVHALLGENGAGKSTLMKILAGAEEPDSGTIEIDGVPFRAAGPLDALQRGVAMIYQELNLALHLTVEENIALGREPRRAGLLDRSKMRRIAEEALAPLGRPDVEPERRVSDLGPGARQVVEIARAIAAKARIIVMDEPTSSLARPDADQLLALVRRMSAEGVSVVYISHFLEEVQRVADRYTVLRDGRSVASGDIAGTPIPQIVEQMVGRKLDEVYPEIRASATRGVALECRHVSAAPAPRDVSFTLYRGEVLGIFGLVGAGRTETLRAIFGLDRKQSGHVVVHGRMDDGASPHAHIVQGMGLLSENRKEEGLLLNRSIEENMTLSHMRPFSRFGMLDGRARTAAATRWIRELSIRCRGPRQEVRALSGGNQQKTAIARLLHQDASVLLLDEPTRGVDVGSKAEIYRLVRALAAQGKAVLFVSSYMPELLGVCDRIAVMHRGVLGPARTSPEWTENTLLDAATRGEHPTAAAGGVEP